MSDTEQVHTVRLVIDQGVYPRLHCPFDPADTARPCWNHTESGEPYGLEEGIAAGCVYKDWIEDDGIDAFKGSVEVTFALASADWHGDYFEFRLGQVQPSQDQDDHNGVTNDHPAQSQEPDSPICKSCAADGESSVITLGPSSTTLIGESAFWGEDGKLHSHDPNTITTQLSCNRGHAWAEKSRNRCPVRTCDYGRSA